MTEWRELAEAERWDEIKPYELSLIELRELKKSMVGFVPIILAGDGLEKVRRYIDPHEARNESERAVSLLMRNIEREEESRRPASILRYIKPAVADAKATIIAELGIEFEGHQTFLFRDSDGQWNSLRPDIGEAILQKRIHLWTFQEPPEAYFEWLSLYPWRRGDLVFKLWLDGTFGENTPVDHALYILRNVDFLIETLRYPNAPAYSAPGESALRRILNIEGPGLYEPTFPK